MFKIVVLLFIGLAITCGTCLGASGTIEWDSEKKLTLEARPLGLTSTADGSKVFVLLEGGKLLICSNTGEVLDRLDVAQQSDSIEVAPTGDKLFITSAKDKSLQIIRIENIYEIDVLGSPFKGPVQAPVEIVIFSDFQCPYCSKLVPILDQVKTLYPKEVKVVFKNYPLRNHSYARKAAIAALAANEQGEFWPFHDGLFENHSQIDDTFILMLADKLDLDREQFQRDMKNQKIWAQINKDIQEAKKVGVRGTPTVMVNGKLLQNRSVEGFRARIKKELTRTNEGRSS